MIKPLIAGNWKMHGQSSDVAALLAIADAADGVAGTVDAMICPPATLIMEAARQTADRGLNIGAQDCHVAAQGAHTGDVSAEMIRDAGGVAVIVGHSERRGDHGETDAIVGAKAAAAQRAGLVAIVCVGETEGQRKAGLTGTVVARQIAGSLPDGISPESLVVAYEPVWAIGTGLTPTVTDVADVHQAMRRQLVERFGSSGATIRLLYGGSVKPGNAAELLAVSDVNGALVGGASLKAEDFAGILGAAVDVRGS